MSDERTAPRDPESDGAAAKNSVQVIARVADILRALEGEPDGLSLAQIASRVGLARSTVHRLTVGLAAEGFVVPASPNGRLRLGPSIGRLAAASRRELREELRPHLERLASEVEETVDMAVLDGSQVRFVDQVPGAHRLRAVSSVGSSFPLHCSANGKALLAALPREQAERLLPRTLEALTPKTITSRGALSAELDRIAVSGLAFDRQEHTLGISAVGTVVRDAIGVIAAITIVAPTQRFDENEKFFAERLLRAGRDMSASLGAQT